MSRQTHIFGTRADLEPGLSRHLVARRAKFALCGLHPTTEYPVRDVLEGAELGVSRTGKQVTDPCWLVVDTSIHVVAIPVDHGQGRVSFSVSQKDNPTSITFRPGGVYADGCLVSGSIGTISDDPASTSLYKEFVREVTRGFTKVASYRVGPGALESLRAGVRLVTMGIDESPEYDLKL